MSLVWLEIGGLNIFSMVWFSLVQLKKFGCLLQFEDFCITFSLLHLLSNSLFASLHPENLWLLPRLVDISSLVLVIACQS